MPNRLQWLRDRLTDDHALIGVFIVAFLLAALVWFLWILAGGGLLGILNQARPSKRPNGQRCSSYRGLQVVKVKAAREGCLQIHESYSEISCAGQPANRRIGGPDCSPAC